MAADILVADDVTDNAQKSVGGTDTVTVEQTGVLSVADTAIKWNSESTDLRIVNDGIIESTATDGRAINAGGSATEPRIVTITNGATGIIRAESDAIRINTDITSGTVRLTNAGTILSTVSGQAIDFDGVVSTTAGQIQIDNLAGGVIQSTDADALRPGQGAVITNAGTIYAGKVESLSSDGIDLQAHSGSVINLEGGVISGARHGITTDTDVTVVNYGTIIGRNGSGIGSDGSGSVINHGTIIGDYDGSGNSDGDGIDIDHVGYVENYGTIQALGAAGLHKDGRPNGSDGVTFGHGGIFINHSGALVESVATGVAFGVQATVTNDGTIHAGGLAVATDIGNDVIVNSGTIISESGTAISMGSGDDQLTLLPGSTIIGLVDGNDGNDQITMAGDGDGSFAGAVNFEHLQVASGRWTLTAPSTFSDGTSVADRATLIGTADTLTGAIDNGGTLMIDQSTDAAFAPMLTGTGQLIKTGTGALTIGDQAFIGATRIDRGALLVNGTMLSAITVGSGATLGGTGTVGATTLGSGGTLAAGSGGPLTIRGNFVQEEGSLYIATIVSGQSGASLAVEGSVTLQPGALIALSSDTATDMVGSRYALLSATGGISGSYTVQQDPLADLELRLSSDANSIDGVIVRTGASLARVAQTANQAAVAGPLAALGVDSDAYVALTATITDDVAPAGLSQLAGEVHASLRTVMTQDALGVEDTVRGRMDNLASSRTGLWMQFLGGHGKDDGVRGAADVGHSMIGSMAGVDMALGGNAHIGITGGYTRTTLDVYGLASHARIGATHVLAYAGANSGAFRVRGTIGYAWNHIDTRRSIAIDGFSDQNRARYIGDTLHGFGEIGYAFSYRGGTIEPFVRGMALHLHTGSFEENGGNAALVGSGESVTAKFSDVGVRWAMPLAPTVQLRVSTAWQQAYHIVQSEARLAFAKGGSSFDVIGTGLSRNAVTPRLDIAWQPVEGFRVSAGYAGLYGARNRQSNGRLTLGIAF